MPISKSGFAETGLREDKVGGTVCRRSFYNISLPVLTRRTTAN
ncbi:hypothetical protein RISK_000066 [Rhodopirellula islandica]|uniref:Uncharacterized protein n=1 Tax=Rhodopirellula islandica TaxID=595434 RepID=A0A0J1BN46_RHOIS|nr:hypothetical protein RISK_000066 [Rhodopirellula islandica]